MIKDPIVQFVCFVTDLGLDEFLPEWERYAKRLMNKKCEPVLQQSVRGSKSRFRYISQHEWPNADFHFSFMNERKSEHFQEQKARVVQIGGYISLQPQGAGQCEDGDLKLIAFIGHNETDIDSYRKLPCYRRLDIYQAYYESCSFGYVLEFFVSENDADDLMVQIRQKQGVEAGYYKECMVHA
jgi:hypothetical protein